MTSQPRKKRIFLKDLIIVKFINSNKRIIRYFQKDKKIRLKDLIEKIQIDKKGVINHYLYFGFMLNDEFFLIEELFKILLEQDIKDLGFIEDKPHKNT